MRPQKQDVSTCMSTNLADKGSQTDPLETSGSVVLETLNAMREQMALMRADLNRLLSNKPQAIVLPD